MRRGSSSAIMVVVLLLPMAWAFVAAVVVPEYEAIDRAATTSPTRAVMKRAAHD
jgi:hypothetical protein